MADEVILFKMAIGLVLGMVLGSFATVLFYRLPRGISIVTPRSHCPSCKTQLHIRDLVPLLSYVLNQGKCRHCGAAIPPHYFLIESTVTLITFALVMFVF